MELSAKEKLILKIYGDEELKIYQAKVKEYKEQAIKLGYDPNKVATTEMIKNIVRDEGGKGEEQYQVHYRNVKSRKIKSNE